MYFGHGQYTMYFIDNPRIQCMGHGGGMQWFSMVLVNFDVFWRSSHTMYFLWKSLNSLHGTYGWANDFPCILVNFDVLWERGYNMYFLENLRIPCIVKRGNHRKSSNSVHKTWGGPQDFLWIWVNFRVFSGCKCTMYFLRNVEFCAWEIQRNHGFL